MKSLDLARTGADGIVQHRHTAQSAFLKAQAGLLSRAAGSV
jgi:hypothetical protein